MYKLLPLKLNIALLLLLFSVAASLQSQTASDRENLYTDLPLVVIDTWGEDIPDDPKITAWLKIIDNGHGEKNNWQQDGTDYEGYAGIELRGQSSQMFPKTSFSIELRKEDGTDTTAALLGMPAEEDWVLYAPYSDKTLLRNAITFYLGNLMGSWQPHYRFCELYLNGEYYGIYALTESIKRGRSRVDISKLKPDEISGDDLTGGYIIKADKMDGLRSDEYFTINSGIYNQNPDKYEFTYVYPKYDEIAPEQKTYISKFLSDAQNALNGDHFSDLSDGFRKYFDARSFVDFQIMQELTNNVDGYKFSTFFYKDKDSRGGKLNAGPLWDFDLCYGNEDYTDFNLQTDTWLYPKFSDYYGGRIHWWARMMEDLSYRSLFMSRWKNLRMGPFSTDSVMLFIDNTIDYLGDAVARNFERWPVIGEYIWPNYFIGQTYEEEVDYLKDWITDRMNWMDANVMLADNVSDNYNKQELLVFPNPVRDMINIYLYTDQSSELRTEIYDLLGRKAVIRTYMPEGAGYQLINFDVDLAPGYYILKVFQGSKQKGSKNILVGRK
ncbi:MAG: T9SS type A sorting domain-containing protein [Bacteroidales bacterium]|jgi:hypothetical protein|nr:T9SS type A sorting domain-containing protein [Bacteroidales bacterium]